MKLLDFILKITRPSSKSQNEPAQTPPMYQNTGTTDTITDDSKTALELKQRDSADNVSDSYIETLAFIEANSPDDDAFIKKQDRQIKSVQRASDKYYRTENITTYIQFWEDLWKNGGLIFEGAHWHFELADLYIKTKQFDSAMNFVLMIKKLRPQYASKADYYIETITKQKNKPQKIKRTNSSKSPKANR